MAIGTYSELQTAVINWLERPDLTARVPEFIVLFESLARRELKEWLRTVVTATAVTGDYTLTNVDEVRGVALNDGAGGSYNGPLDALDFDGFHQKMACDASVRSPARFFYAERDESADTYKLKFYPPNSSASPIANLAIDCVGFLLALSDSQTTNRLLTASPDAYLFGSLSAASGYLQHDERLGLWQGLADRAIAGLRGNAERKVVGAKQRHVTLPRVFG